MRRSRAYAASSASTALPILSRSAKMPDVGRTRTRTARLPTVVVLPGGQPRGEARPQGHGRGDDLVIDHDGARSLRTACRARRPGVAAAANSTRPRAARPEPAATSPAGGCWPAPRRASGPAGRGWPGAGFCGSSASTASKASQRKIAAPAVRTDAAAREEWVSRRTRRRMIRSDFHADALGEVLLADLFPQGSQRAGRSAAESVHALDFLDCDAGNLRHYAVCDRGRAPAVRPCGRSGVRQCGGLRRGCRDGVLLDVCRGVRLGGQGNHS